MKGWRLLGIHDAVESRQINSLHGYKVVGSSSRNARYSHFKMENGMVDRDCLS